MITTTVLLLAGDRARASARRSLDSARRHAATVKTGPFEYCDTCEMPLWTRNDVHCYQGRYAFCCEPCYQAYVHACESEG